MKLLLTSAGLRTPEIVLACTELVGKPAEKISVAVINEGYAPETGDHRWVLDDLNLAAEAYGGRFEFVNLLALEPTTAKERIAAADIIYVEGGDTPYLMHIINKTKFRHTLLEALETKVYVGSSAGSMIIGKRLPLEVNEAIYSEGTSTYPGQNYLELCDFSIMPHIEPESNGPRRLRWHKAQDLYDGKIYGLTDNSAIIVTDMNVKVIRGTID
jgi:dipeptidase E